MVFTLLFHDSAVMTSVQLIEFLQFLFIRNLNSHCVLTKLKSFRD